MPLSTSSSAALRHQCSRRISSTSQMTRPLPHRLFSTTPAHRVTKLRRQAYMWLKGPGAVFRDPLPGSTNYLSAYDQDGRLRRSSPRDAERASRDKDEITEGAADADAEAGEAGASIQSVNAADGGIPEEMNIAGGRALPPERARDLMPFPRNQSFRSQPVLSEETRSRIYEDITQHEMTVREASEKHGVDIARVAAVVRLKAVEDEWTKSGKPMATAYSQAVLSMLPQTPRGRTHESINDLPVHAATTPQIFYPVSESRQFTRADAGEVFQKGLLPADARIPHPQMVRALLPDAADLPSNGAQRAKALRQEMRQRDEIAEGRATARERRRREHTTAVASGRWEFRFEDVVVDDKSTGRFAKGVGQRYGVPMQDRKKSQVKIPTRVE